MNERDLLLAYGEWLDAQTLIVGDEASGDKRSLDQLAIDFLAEMATHAHDYSVPQRLVAGVAEPLETSADWGGPARIKDH